MSGIVMFKKYFFLVAVFCVLSASTADQKKTFEQALHKACYNYDMQTIQFFLANGVDCNCQADDDEGWTPLHIACDNNYEALVNILIQTYKANVNVIDKQKNTPLHKACDKQNLPIIKLLVQAGADSGMCDSQGVSPLHLCNMIHIAEYLLYHGSPVNTCDVFGFTPLDCIIYSLDNEAFRNFMISHGAITNKCTLPHCNDVVVQCKRLIALHDHQALNMLVQFYNNTTLVQDLFVHAYFHKNMLCYMKLVAENMQACQKSTSSEFYKKLSLKDQQALYTFLLRLRIKNNDYKDVTIILQSTKKA